MHEDIDGQPQKTKQEDEDENENESAPSTVTGHLKQLMFTKDDVIISAIGEEKRNIEEENRKFRSR